MEFKTLEINHLSEGVIEVTINRPKALNALNHQVISDLGDFFQPENNLLLGKRVIILKGSGDKAFVAGADILEFKDLNTQEAIELSLRGKKVFDSIEEFHVPVIALINGYALGGGLELAMACHIRWAVEGSRFSLPELSLGLIPGYSGTQRLAHLIGKGRALDLILTGKMIDAETALQFGLVTGISTQESETDDIQKLISKIMKNAPLAIRDSIRCVNAGFNSQVDGDTLESRLFGHLMTSQDGTEGCQAFMEKRKPDFKGH